MQKLTVEELLEKDLSWFDSCTVEELEYYIETLESAAAGDHITQLTLKILINSLYGALGNKHFILANPDMAAAVTSSGRFFIQLVANNVERELQALLPSEEPYVIYGDTDSLSSVAILNTRGLIKLTTENGSILVGPNDKILVNDTEVVSLDQLQCMDFSKIHTVAKLEN